MKRIFLALAVAPALLLCACSIGSAPIGTAVSVAAGAAELGLQLFAADVVADIDAGRLPDVAAARARLRELELRAQGLATARAAHDLQLAARGVALPDSVSFARDQTDAIVDSAKDRLLQLIDPG